MIGPAIKQWQNRPVPGGWGFIYKIGEQQWALDGPTPQRIVDQIVQIQTTNRVFQGVRPIWDMCNEIWQKKAPERAIKFEKVVKDTRSAVPLRGHWEFGPESFGPILWFWLHSFGMKFDQQHWNAAIERITSILDPKESPLNGCDRCFLEWKAIIGTEKPFEVNDEKSAALWTFNVHNRINKKLGKPQVTFAFAARMFGWKVDL